MYQFGGLSDKRLPTRSCARARPITEWRIAAVRLACVASATVAAVSLSLPQDKMGIGDRTNGGGIWIDAVAGRDAQAALVRLLNKPNAQGVVVWHIAVSDTNLVARYKIHHGTWAEEQRCEPQYDQRSTTDPSR